MSNFSLDPSLYGEEHKPPVLAGVETYAQQAPMSHQHPLHQYSYQHQPQHPHQQTPQPAPMSGDSSAVLTDGAMPPQSDVDEFLRKKRKAREHKACYPCRQRKVKYVSFAIVCGKWELTASKVRFVKTLPDMP